MIIHSTRLRRGEFEETLARFNKIVKNNPDAPHFRDDEHKKSDAGNQCMLHIRHTFLMSLMRRALNMPQFVLTRGVWTWRVLAFMRRALNMPQFVLGEMFRIDQITLSQVCGYT